MAFFTTRLYKCVYNLETKVVRVIFNVYELDLRRYNPILQSGHHPVYLLHESASYFV